MALPLPTVVSEGSSVEYTGTFRDKSGQLIVSMDSLTVTLWDEATGSIVNGRSAQNILNANGGIYSAGVFTLALTPLDTIIIDTNASVEVRRMTFDARWNGGAGRKTHDVSFHVRNLRMIVA